MLDFDVIDANAPPVLGMRACLDLNLVKIIHTVDAQDHTTHEHYDEYADVFKGI